MRTTTVWTRPMGCCRYACFISGRYKVERNVKRYSRIKAELTMLFSEKKTQNTNYVIKIADRVCFSFLVHGRNSKLSSVRSSVLVFHGSHFTTLVTIRHPYHWAILEFSIILLWSYLSIKSISLNNEDDTCLIIKCVKTIFHCTNIWLRKLLKGGLPNSKKTPFNYSIWDFGPYPFKRLWRRF